MLLEASPQLNSLPQQWLNHLLHHMRRPGQSRDDIVRRSAGLPAAFVALFAGEPTGNPKTLLHTGEADISTRTNHRCKKPRLRHLASGSEPVLHSVDYFEHILAQVCDLLWLLICLLPLSHFLLGSPQIFFLTLMRLLSACSTELIALLVVLSQICRLPIHLPQPVHKIIFMLLLLTSHRSTFLCIDE